LANAHKGEVEFTLDKKVYTLHFSINAMCELEDKLGGSVVEMANIAADPSKISMKTMRTLFWAGLLDHHEAITEVDAGRLIDQIGLVDAMQMLAKAFTLSFPAEVVAAGPLAEAAQQASTGKAH
jgi:tail tube GTA-gp10-like protein